MPVFVVVVLAIPFPPWAGRSRRGGGRRRGPSLPTRHEGRRIGGCEGVCKAGGGGPDRKTGKEGGREGSERGESTRQHIRNRMPPKVLALSLLHRSSVHYRSPAPSKPNRLPNTNNHPSLSAQPANPPFTMEHAGCGCNSCSCQNWYASFPYPLPEPHGGWRSSPCDPPPFIQEERRKLTCVVP